MSELANFISTMRIALDKLEATTKQPKLDVKEDYCCVPLRLPQYNRMEGLKFFIENKAEIQAWCEKNPTADDVYYVSEDETLPLYLTEPSVVMAGSCIVAGLHKEIRYIADANKLIYSDICGWKPSDIDIFHLGTDKPIRNKDLCGVDLVHVTDKTVTDLLLNFDLPCCRAARDFKGNLWITAQCVNSILTGVQMIPESISTPEKFMEMGGKVLTLEMVVDRQTITDQNRRNCKVREYNPELVKDTRDAMLRWFAERFFDRLKKYEDRGFKVKFVKTGSVPSWLVKRFTYAQPNIGK